MRTLFAFICLLWTSSLLAQTNQFIHNEVKRKYILYTPKNYNPQKSYPLVFHFHGAGMTPAEQMLYTRFNETADTHGFIVVYPKGINEDWNVGFGMSYKKGPDDIGFIEALLDQLEKDLPIDRRKIFAMGLSRGGFFCQRIAAELAHRFSAVASIGATLPDSVAYYHAHKKEIGLLMVHGKSDKIVRYEGKKGGYASAIDSYRYWKTSSFGKDKIVKIDKNPGDGTAIEILESSSSKKTIGLISIENGGHTWPGADSFNIGLPIGLTSMEININEYIWAFFEKQK